MAVAAIGRCHCRRQRCLPAKLPAGDRAGCPRAITLPGPGKLLIEKVPNAAKKQQGQNPHAGATGSEQGAKEHSADGAAKKPAHQAATETAAGFARR